MKKIIYIALLITSVFGFAQTSLYAPVIYKSNVSSADLGSTGGVKFRWTPSRLTNTSSSGTVGAYVCGMMGGDSLDATSSTTYTGAYTLMLKPPVIRTGGNVAISTGYALRSEGPVFITTGSLLIGSGGLTTTANAGFGIGTGLGARVHSVSTTEQLRLGYDASNYLSCTIASTGSATLALTGTSPAFTFSQACIFNSTITTNSSTGQANFVAVTTGTTGTTQAELLIGGASTVRFRAASRGVTQSTATAGDAYASWLIGTQGYTEAATGTHAIAANVAIKPITITNAAGTTTNSVSLYVENANAEGIATNNYAFWSDAGNNRLDGNTSLGPVTTPLAYAHLGAGTTTVPAAIIEDATNLTTTPINGALEYDAGKLYFTPGATIRQEINYPAFGDLYEDAGATNISLTTAGTYYQWVNSTVGTSLLTTLSASTDNITIAAGGDGLYEVNIPVSFTGTASTVFQFDLFLNGSRVTNIGCRAKTNASGTIVASCAAGGFVALVANDVLDVRVTSETNSVIATPQKLNLNIKRIRK